MNHSNKIKVAVITMSFPYNREAFAINEFLHLKKHCDVAVHSLRPKHKIADTLVKKYGMNDLEMSYYSPTTLLFFPIYILRHPFVFLYLLFSIFRIKFGKFSYLLKALCLVPRVMELFVQLKKNPPDIVHAYWSHYPTLVSLLAKKYLKNIQFTVCHVAYDVYHEYNMSAYSKNIFDTHFSICEENIKYLETIGIKCEAVQVVYRGLPESYTHHPLESKQKFSILSVGTLLPVKAFDLVLEVFAQLKQHYPNAHLTIGGDGPERPYLLQKKEELGLTDVEFTGFLLRDEVIELMNTSEIFLLMSKNERIANVAKEAMLMQCYCVATHTPGVEELIEHKSNGFIVENGNVDEAVKNIQFIWNNREQTQDILYNARNTICDKFILEKNIHTYIETWKGLVQRTRYSD